MEETKLTYEFLFIGKEDDHFVHNYVYEHLDSGEKLFVNFGMLGNAVLAEEVGQNIFEVLKSNFLLTPGQLKTSGPAESDDQDDEEHDYDPYTRFEEALKMINREIKRMQEEKEFKFQANLDVVIAVISGATLYLTQTGEAEAYLLRRKLISVVSEGLTSSDENEVFTNVASGLLEPADTLVLSTTRLLRYVSKTHMAKSLDRLHLQHSLDDLKGVLDTEITQKSGILGIRIEGMIEDGEALAKGKKKFALPKNVCWPKVSVFSSLAKFAALVKEKKSLLGDVITRRRPVFFADFFRMTKDKVLAAVLVLVIILMVGVYLVHKRSLEQERLNELEATLQQVEETVSLATTKGNYNKSQAADLLDQAEEDALAVLNAGFLRAQATYLLDQIQSERDRLDSVVRIVEPRVVADLAGKRSTVDALGLISAGGDLFAYEYNALYRIVLDKVQDPLTIDEKEVVVAGAYLEDQDALVFLTQSGQIIEYRDGLFFFMDTLDQQWHAGIDISTYGNRVYILDAAGNQIWRYTRKERDQYSSAEEYNTSGDLKNGVSMAIDSSIFVLNLDGSVSKFYSGSPKSLRVDKAPMQSPKEPVSIYTDKDTAQIFILDSATNRILEYYKDSSSDNIVYAKQYILSGVGELKDVYFDKKSQNLYVLDSTKVYQVDTK